MRKIMYEIARFALVIVMVLATFAAFCTAAKADTKFYIVGGVHERGAVIKVWTPSIDGEERLIYIDCSRKNQDQIGCIIAAEKVRHERRITSLEKEM